MKQLAKYILYVSSLILLVISPANAFNKFTEYRIPVSTIKSASIGAFEVEDPVPLEIFFNDGKNKLVILTDDHVHECVRTINSAIGNLSDSIQINVHETASTLNGIVITACFVTAGKS